MKFNKEDAKRKLLSPGEYDFEVIKAKDSISKSKNEQIELTLKIWTTEGNTVLVFDYLVAGIKTAWKIEHFCQAVGLLEKFENEELEAGDCEGKSGKVKIKIKKDESGEYPDKNTVADYIKPEASDGKVANKEEKKEPFNDDIPW